MFKFLRSCTLTLSCVVISHVIHAAPIPKQGFQVSTNLDFDVRGKRVKASSDMIIENGFSGWSPMVPKKSDVMVLGRIVKVDSETVQLEYLILDTTSNKSLRRPLLIGISPKN